MTPIHPHTISASLLALPVAMAFSRRLLLTCKSPVAATASAVDVKIKIIESRANNMTETLRTIEGYRHGGLND
jgi:hypothetical protein